MEEACGSCGSTSEKVYRCTNCGADLVGNGEGGVSQ